MLMILLLLVLALSVLLICLILKSPDPTRWKIIWSSPILVILVSGIVVCLNGIRWEWLNKEQARCLCAQMPKEPACQKNDLAYNQVLSCFMEDGQSFQAVELGQNWKHSHCLTAAEKSTLAHLELDQQPLQAGENQPFFRVIWGNEEPDRKAQLLQQWALGIDGSSCKDATPELTSLRCALKADAERRQGLRAE